MTRRTPSRGPDELMAILDQEEPAVTTSVTASSINRASAERMFGLVQRAREVLSARFVGSSTNGHQLGARVATRALLAVQESVSSIGAKLVGHDTLKGHLPTAILEATELLFSPQVLPGSVIFELSRPTGSEDMLAEREDRPLLDESFLKFFELIEAVTAANSQPDDVPITVRELGPRAAKHIFDLCAVLVDESLGLDFEWVNRNGEAKSANLTNGTARYLKQVARENTSHTVDHDLVGVLLTASVEKKQKLRLRAADLSIVSMSASDDIRATLATFYNKPVKIKVAQTETINLTTGKITVTNALLGIEEFDEVAEAPRDGPVTH